MHSNLKKIEQTYQITMRDVPNRLTTPSKDAWDGATNRAKPDYEETRLYETSQRKGRIVAP